MERMLESVLDSIIEGIIIVNKDANVVYVNKNASKLLGLSSDILGKYVEDVVENTRLHIVVRTGLPEIDQLQRTENAVIITSRLPIKDERGEIIGAVAVFRDITSIRKLAEEITNLKEVEAQLKAIIDSTNDAISVADENGIVRIVNRAYTKITGYAAEEVIGKPATVDIAEGESIHMLIAKMRQPIYNARLKVGPARKEVIVNATPLFVHGKFKGSVAVVHDVSEIMQLNNELEEIKRLIRHMKAQYTFDDIIGDSRIMQIAKEQAKRVAQTPATVLLRGESGTGKELFAHAIHNVSPRKNKPFVSVNCAAIPESILESELFGYEEGAFTGAVRGGKKGLVEEADGGTLFLDEVGKLPISLQPKLLRFIESKEFVPVGGRNVKKVDVRIIAATNTDLEKMVKSGEFLPDLYFRLNVFPIYLPPLKERREDIPKIAMHIVRKLNQQYGRMVEGMNPAVMHYITNKEWQGNVREMENFIGRIMINMGPEERIIEMKHLPEKAEVNEMGNFETFEIRALKDMVESYEKQVIQEALKKCNGDKSKAAEMLDVSVRTLYYKMERYGID
ncbi:MAG TPA: sigma 54-interacting transcriptional regulator [Fervidobacterium sp.]|jgi:PAS domain S-box-containing protein|nr:sigma 54-interacting transcriptional regulator [Fervidobacterium sp.]MBP8657926.1 sigma 54-interacting transcriptional regulator [Fervidobacterium sp.]HOS52505.1 sigma 54-interacting transcriptional regulator [Fervidobacterium sp.]HQI09970.1 sigma 54-interacting transcriptional regulator [Fervidobacterium sp.]HRT01946.1 sigma 54-interacting transcriptional regulator [Fervidobacterium sp.]